MQQPDHAEPQRQQHPQRCGDGDVRGVVRRQRPAGVHRCEGCVEVEPGSRVVERADHVVGEASDGQEGLALVARTHPDVVLMDFRMPRLDGLAAPPV